MASSLLEKTTPLEHELVETAADIASSQGHRVFLVGGPLRDLLLDRPRVDMDFTLEEGVEEFAAELARRYNGELRSYPQFLTHKVDASELPPVDVTTTRREVYSRPGALPEVFPSTLHQDLCRRDFTVNAMALDLSTGEIEDPFGGGEDLSQKTMRVLHPQSFRDDPTRVFRCIRLATRLGFNTEAQTGRWLREAVDQDFLSTVSRERLWREFSIALTEPDRATILYEFARAGALAVLTGRTSAEPETLERLGRADKLLRILPADASSVFLAILGVDQGPERFRGSGLTAGQIDAVNTSATEASRLSSQARERSEREAFELLRRGSPETLVVAAVLDPAIEPLVARFGEYSNLQIGVRGSQLGVPPGPHIGRALEATRAALFFGDIAPAEAADFARRAAQEYLEGKAP